MKYLKKINEAYLKDVYEDCINYNMIKDLFDLLLDDYIDNGYTLEVKAWIKISKMFGADSVVEILKITMNHINTEYSWKLWTISDRVGHNDVDVNKRQIDHYTFEVSKQRPFMGNLVENVREIEYRLRAMYPNESIYQKHF